MKCLSHPFVFIEYDNRLFARWLHYTQYQNPLNPGSHIKRSTDSAKCRADDGVILRESSVQVALVRRTRNVNRILARAKLRNPTNRL